MGEGQLPGEQAMSPESPEAPHIRLTRLPRSRSSDMVAVHVPGLFLVPAVGSLVWSRVVCSVCCWMVALWAECWGTHVSHLHPPAGSRYPQLRINGVLGESPAPPHPPTPGSGLQFVVRLWAFSFVAASFTLSCASSCVGGTFQGRRDR